MGLGEPHTLDLQVRLCKACPTLEQAGGSGSSGPRGGACYLLVPTHHGLITRARAS